MLNVSSFMFYVSEDTFALFLSKYIIKVASFTFTSNKRGNQYVKNTILGYPQEP